MGLNRVEPGKVVPMKPRPAVEFLPPLQERESLAKRAERQNVRMRDFWFLKRTGNLRDSLAIDRTSGREFI
jgi:hypothetical protein